MQVPCNYLAGLSYSFFRRKNNTQKQTNEGPPERASKQTIRYNTNETNNANKRSNTKMTITNIEWVACMNNLVHGGSCAQRGHVALSYTEFSMGFPIEIIEHQPLDKVVWVNPFKDTLEVPSGNFSHSY